MIEIDHVDKWYATRLGRKYVLRSATASIASGLNVGVVGRNGAGKSTLLRMIGGTDMPNQGEIRVTGSISWPMGLAGGYQGSMTGRENARLVCRIYGRDAEETRYIADFVREFSDLGKDFDLPMKTYSSGMRARLSFAVSMAFDFDYYLIDELTAVGDPNFKEKSHAALVEKKRSANFIMASHDIQSLAKDADVILLVEDGGLVVFTDPPAAVAAYQELMR